MVRHTSKFPRGPEDLTPQWLTYALRSSGALPVGEVVAVEAALVPYQGQASRVYGLTLEYTGYPSPPPTKLVAKLPPLSTYQSDQELWRSFVAEATFYQNNTRSALPIPVCYFADVDPQGQEGFVLLLEDLRPLVPLIYVDTEQRLLDGIDSTMNSVALLHSHFWQKEATAERRGVERLAAPGSPAFIAGSKPTMQALYARYQGILPKALREFCEALNRESPALVRGFSSAPRTLVHYDVHPGQVMAGLPNRPAILIDWATVRWGAPMSDVGMSLGPWAAPHELRWAKLYHAELNQQLGRDHAWPWDDFHRLHRVSPPYLGISLYVVAFMAERQLEQIVQSIPDRSWFPRPTWQEDFLQWPAGWIERHGSIDALAELESFGQALLQADARVISTAAPQSGGAATPAEPAGEQDSLPRRRTMPPPSLSLSSVPPARASAPPLNLVPRHARGPAKRFPTAAEDLTPRWLTDALLSSGALSDGEVVNVEAELVEYQGNASRVYGLKLEYSGCDEPPPTRLIAKIPPDAAYQPLADLQQNNRCEAIFYRHYGRESRLPIPTCYFADVHTTAHAGFVLLLEDLRPSIPLEYVADEQEVDDGLIATMKSVAALHARFWRRDALARENWLNPGIYRGHPETAKWYRGVVERVRARHGARLSAPMQQFCELVQTESAALFHGFLLFPRTLIHFDVHPRQVMFGASRKAVLIDWGAAMYNVPVLDICLDGGPWSAQREAHWHRTYYAALSEHLARDNQSWAWDDFELCVRAHPPRLDILLYALAYMDEAQWERTAAGILDRPWSRQPTWQQYCFDWITDWMERHRTLDACAEVVARGAALLKK